MGFSFKEMALEFLEGYCFEKHLKKNGGGGGYGHQNHFYFLRKYIFQKFVYFKFFTLWQSRLLMRKVSIKITVHK